MIGLLLVELRRSRWKILLGILIMGPAFFSLYLSQPSWVSLVWAYALAVAFGVLAAADLLALPGGTTDSWAFFRERPAGPWTVVFANLLAIVMVVGLAVLGAIIFVGLAITLASAGLARIEQLYGFQTEISALFTTTATIFQMGLIGAACGVLAACLTRREETALLAGLLLAGAGGVLMFLLQIFVMLFITIVPTIVPNPVFLMELFYSAQGFMGMVFTITGAAWILGVAGLRAQMAPE